MADDAFLDQLLRGREKELKLLRIMRDREIVARPDRFELEATLVWLGGGDPEDAIMRLRALRKRARANGSLPGEISCLVHLWPLVSNYISWRAAIPECRALARLAPEAEYVRTLGFVLENANQHADARRVYERAANAKGADPQLREGISNDLKRLDSARARPSRRRK